MNFSQELVSDANYIYSYDNNAVVIRERNNPDLNRLTASLILTADQIITDHPNCCVADMIMSDIIFLTTLAPEILIIRTKSNLQRLPPDLLILLSEKSIGIEYMSLGAACRTYNLLVAEERRVVFVASLGIN